MSVLVVGIIAAGIAVLGVYGVFSPPGIIRIARRLLTRMGFGGALLVRVALGVALWNSAPLAATPVAFRVLAVVALLSALVLLMLGAPRLERFIDWWSEGSPWFVRAWCVVAIAFGAFLYASLLLG